MKRQAIDDRTNNQSGKGLLPILCAAAVLAACSRGDVPPSPSIPQVNIITVNVRPMPLDLKYSARARGAREVEVRARVSGILLKRYYREGEHVAANALLFKIDPAPFMEEAGRLRGLEAVEKARLVEATAQRDRLVTLFGKGFISHRERDAAVASYATAYASAEAAKAALHQAELNLSYTEVRAPIAGSTGRESRSEGSLVEAGGPSSLLTTIVQADRLYIDFTLPEHEARLVRAAMSKNQVSVRLAPDSKGEIVQAAKLEFLDTRIDPDSGTVPARAVLDNKDGGLAAGQFVLARIEGLASAPAIFLPVRAVLNTPEGAMVWVVDKDDKVQPRPLKLGHSAGNLVEVAEGLMAGDRVIVDGILKVQPGAAVKSTIVDVNDPPGGPVVEQKPPANADKKKGNEQQANAAPAEQK
ncbi:MAG: efflux RND transporter periplasmic adaptor subunit [Sterolibacterium sp.]|nr:efflux RND transporter periplasmic adaptor subunit [Sterolibacterium sp.]